MPNKPCNLCTVFAATHGDVCRYCAHERRISIIESRYEKLMIDLGKEFSKIAKSSFASMTGLDQEPLEKILKRLERIEMKQNRVTLEDDDVPF